MPKEVQLPAVQKITSFDDAKKFEFALPEDAEKIRKVCKRLHCYISVRKSGEHTLKRLEQGYAAKGHHILQKSLKPKSLNDNGVTGKKRKFIEDRALGFVGFWEKVTEDTYSPLGVRTVEKWEPVKKRNTYTWVLRPGNARKYKNWVSFQDIEKVGSVPQDAYTGDYDLHEIFVKPSGGQSYLRGLSTPDDVTETDILFKILDQGQFKIKAERLAKRGFSIGVAGLLNAEIQRSRTGIKTTTVRDEFAQVIQHGPQHGFPAFVLSAKKKKEKWVQSLVNFDPDVLAFYPNGEMKILRTTEAIRKHLYESAGCTVSPWWEQSHGINVAIQQVLKMDGLTKVPKEPGSGLLKTLVDLSKGKQAARQPHKAWVALRNEWERLGYELVSSKGIVGGTGSKKRTLEKKLNILERILRGDAL